MLLSCLFGFVDLSQGERIKPPCSVTVRACICAHSSRAAKQRVFIVLITLRSSLYPVELTVHISFTAYLLYKIRLPLSNCFLCLCLFFNQKFERRGKRPVGAPKQCPLYAFGVFCQCSFCSRLP